MADMLQVYRREKRSLGDVLLQSGFIKTKRPPSLYNNVRGLGMNKARSMWCPHCHSGTQRTEPKDETAFKEDTPAVSSQVRLGAT